MITTYENNALADAQTYPNLSVIYLELTVFSERVVVALNGIWGTAEQRSAAAAVLNFLARPESIQAGVQSPF